MRVVGRVAALFRYPVKSMAAEPLDEIDVAWHGLADDRRWAFLREGRAADGFPWLTLRQRPDLSRFRPRLAADGRVLVRTPSGALLEVTDPALATELGGGVRPQKLDRGTFDALPLSLISTRTIAAFGVDALRFRPNLIVEPYGDEPFPEDGWVGGTVRLGSLLMRVDRRDKRCMVVNIDPSTGLRDPGVLRAIARERDMCLGVYGSVVEPGHVAVGDQVSASAMSTAVTA